MTDEAKLRQKAAAYRVKRAALIDVLEVLALMGLGAAIGLMIAALVATMLG